MLTIMNSKLLQYEFNKYIDLIKCAITMKDAQTMIDNIIDIIDLDMDNKNKLFCLLSGIAKSTKYANSYDLETMFNVIYDLNNEKYKEDVLDCILIHRKNISDTVQINALTRITNIKPFKFGKFSNIHDSRKILDTIMFDTKTCPHCFTQCKAHKESDYVVCGYTNDIIGYDWKGCGKDWCFQCCKKLCKSWDKNMLFIQQNRFHNSTCCKLHAEKSKSVNLYPIEYCQCKNFNVRRDLLNKCDNYDKINLFNIIDESFDLD